MISNVHGGQIFVASIIGLFSLHLWVARLQVKNVVRRIGAFLCCWSWSGKKLDSQGLAHIRFWQRWQQVRIQHFKSATAITTHAAGLVLLALLLFTDACSKVLWDPWTREFPVLITYAAGYALLLLNLATSARVTSHRVELVYSGFLFMAINSVLNIETGPMFFLLRGCDVLMQGLLALVVLDIRMSSIGGALYAVSCCVSCLRNASAFRDDEHVLAQKHVQYYIFLEFALWLFSCGGAYAAEYWLKASVKANIETEDVQEALHRVLSALCDADVNLNTDLMVQNPSQQLLHMLAPEAKGDVSILQDKDFSAFIPSAEDRRRFLEFTSSSSAGPAQSASTAAAAHVQLCDVRGNSFRADLFHTHLQVNSTLFHLIGIRYSESRCEYPDSSTFQTVPENLPTGLELGHSEPVPVELASTFGAPTEGGRTLAQELWRCPRCRATRQDWGDTTSCFSGHEDTESLIHRLLPVPRGEPPPAVGQADRQTVSNHFTSLYEWAPEACRHVLSQTRLTYNIVQKAAASLQKEEEAQYMQGLQTQVMSLLLFGSKLEARWPGLKPLWYQIMFMVTGAQPVPLRGIMQVAPASFAPTVMAWQPPSYNASHISSIWWELEPQDMYNRVRSEVLAHVAPHVEAPKETEESDS
jgi:hypothetical protein